MIAAVLDTDTVLSGIGWGRAPSRRLVHAVAGGRVVPVTCPAMLRELERVLHRKELARVFPDPGHLLELVRRVSLVVEPSSEITTLDREHANRMLEAARTAGADYIVSSDIELLRLGYYAGAKIVRPHPS